VGDLDTSPDANTSTRQQADQSTTVATPDRNSMVVDDVIAEASTNSQGMPPPPRPANLLDDPMTESLDSLLSGLSRSLQTPQTGASSSASAASQTHATPPSPSQQSILTDAGSDPNIITIEDLNEERTAIRGPLIDRCLDVINAHGEVTFEVSDLIGTVVNKSPDPAAMRNEMAQTLVNALISFGMEEDIRPAGKKIAAYAHLLALMLQDKTFFAACIPELKENLDGILGFVKLGPVNSTEESSPWIAHILLIVEVLLSEDSQPQETKWKTPMTETETIDQPVLKIEEPVVSAEARTTLLDSILDILTRVGKDESVALAVLRILVILTRTRSIAHSMGEKKNIQRLFVMAKQLAGHATVRLQSPLMLILRHIVEDDETIKQIMRSDIKAFFDAPRTHRNVDMKSYLLSCSGLAIRAPELFVEVSNEMVKLVKWTPIAAESAGRQIIELQDKYSRRSRSVPGSMVLPAVRTTEVLSLEDIKPSTEAVEGENSEKPKPTHPELKAPVVENPDGVIHFLLSELMNYRDVDDKDSTALSMDKKAPEITSAASDVPMPDATATATATSSGDDASPPLAIKDAKKLKIEFKAEEHPIYMYRCFLLQCLTELLSCYNRTKIEFINFKRSAPPQAMTPSKPRSSVVNYLLSDLIPVGTLDHNDSTNLRKKLTTSSWADSVITALLSKTGEQIVDRNSDPSDLDDEPDLYYVRRFVLENVLKAYQSASSSTESLDIKYARMLSLADLMSHIMAGKDNHGGPDPQVQSRSAQQLKRIMFEKGFIAALTGSIADIDLNFPGAKRAVKYILRPLKVLTQTAIDLSDEGKITAASGQGDEDEIESATSVSEVEDDREETPDLFRNSTLGMFEPGRDE
jgi:E3 ubiquitin-protein ligase HUWE1